MEATPHLSSNPITQVEFAALYSMNRNQPGLTYLVRKGIGTGYYVWRVAVAEDPGRQGEEQLVCVTPRKERMVNGRATLYEQTTHPKFFFKNPEQVSYVHPAAAQPSGQCAERGVCGKLTYMYGIWPYYHQVFLLVEPSGFREW